MRLQDRGSRPASSVVRPDARQESQSRLQQSHQSHQVTTSTLLTRCHNCVVQSISFKFLVIVASVFNSLWSGLWSVHWKHFFRRKEESFFWQFVEILFTFLFFLQRTDYQHKILGLLWQHPRLHQRQNTGVPWVNNTSTSFCLLWNPVMAAYQQVSHK